MNETLIRLEGIQKVFDRDGAKLDVLRSIDLSVERGEMAAIVGPSGAGKSTLLHLMGTLDLPTSGSIRYAGREVTGLSANALARFRNEHIGFVFQFHHLLPDFDALENVMMPGFIRGESRKTLEPRARELLDAIGLAHRATHRPSELSGGEQQRVALARALIMRPDVILADEPTGNLDSVTSERMNDLFFEINERFETTFVIVTHSRELASRLPRVIRMRDGEIEGEDRAPAPNARIGRGDEEKEDTPEDGGGDGA
ncbi:MAG: ABC transporter ATP-binding protein [Sandaracinaceae bacterium]|nr:ABC transporter ATP-binding protein [Sandaracinaceae bacterium]